MKIEELKNQIEHQSLSDDVLILACKPDNFIARQYIDEISRYKNLQVVVVDELPRNNFLLEDTETLYLMLTDKLDNIPSNKNTIIIAGKVDKKLVSDRIVVIPNLESWQLKDYARQKLPGLSQKSIEQLMSLTTNEYRLSNEIEKLCQFPAGIQESLFNECMNFGAYSDLNTKTIFDFTNALFNKDKETVNKIYPKLKECDIEPMAFYSVVYNNIRNMVMVALQKYPTEENTGLKSNQIYAVSRAAKKFNREQLIKLFHIASSIDKRLKNGELPAEEIIDYLAVRILSA